MHADHTVDDELQTRQTDTGIGQLGEIKGTVRVADVHHDFERQIRHRIDRVGLDIEAQLAFEDITGVALGAGNRDTLAILKGVRGVAAADHCRDAQLTGDDRRVAGTTATVGDDCAGALHDRLPVRVGHVRHQHVTGLDLVHLGHVLDDAYLARADALTDGTAFDQYLAGLLEQIAFHDVGRSTALHRFRARLDDVQLAVVTVLGPLDVHRALVVLLDNHRLFGQLGHFGIAQAETRAIGRLDVDHLDRTTGLGFFAVNHLDRLAAQIATQDRRAASRQRVLVHVEFVRVDGALYNRLAQAVSAGDEHHVAEAGLGVEGEHDTSRAGFGAHHALHARRQRDQLVVEALVYAVGNRTVVEQ